MLSGMSKKEKPWLAQTAGSPDRKRFEMCAAPDGEVTIASSDTLDFGRPIYRHEIAKALYELRNSAYFEYMLSEGALESALPAARRDFCEDLAQALGFELGPVPR